MTSISPRGLHAATMKELQFVEEQIHKMQTHRVTPHSPLILLIFSYSPLSYGSSYATRSFGRMVIFPKSDNKDFNCLLRPYGSSFTDRKKMIQAIDWFGPLCNYSPYHKDSN